MCGLTFDSKLDTLCFFDRVMEVPQVKTPTSKTVAKCNHQANDIDNKKPHHSLATRQPTNS